MEQCNIFIYLFWLNYIRNGPRKYELRTALANCKQGGDSVQTIKWCNLWNCSFSYDSIGTHTKNENNSCPNLQRRTTQKHVPNGRQRRQWSSLRRRQNRTHGHRHHLLLPHGWSAATDFLNGGPDLEQGELAASMVALLLPSAAYEEVTQRAGVRTAGECRSWMASLCDDRGWAYAMNGGTSFSSKNGSNQIGSPSTNGSHCFGNFPNLDSNQWSKLLTLLNNPTPTQTDTLSVSLPNGAKALALQGGKISLNPKLTL
ncbi:hypothetical protein M9H77_21442 [Catharanthus roseus]|uniref:Uncharacterized protein n=1 Tax=Catharanthus roseus TaxID=4058 RepID=A0ACC0ANG9_CATRO|nr:hypothetical protein M9H77_21442 [Catharanthus roseus]